MGDDGDFVPVIEGAKRGNEEMIEEYIADGADPKQLDHAGNNALHWAAAGGHHETIDHLVTKYGLDVNHANGDGDTPLHKAAWKNRTDAAAALVKHGAHPSRTARNKDGKRPLDLARELDTKKIVAPVMTMDDVEREKKEKEAKEKENS